VGKPIQEWKRCLTPDGSQAGPLVQVGTEGGQGRVLLVEALD